MNTKRTLRIIRQIIREYDEGSLLGSMRDFVATLRSILVASGPECEEVVKQSLRVLFADIDRSPLNLIPDRHLDFLRGLHDRELVGSGLKRTVTEMISEGTYTKVLVLQQFSELLSDMMDLGDRLKNIEQNLAMLNMRVDDIPEERAVINVTVVPQSVSSKDFAERVESLVAVVSALCRLTGGASISTEMQVEDREDSVIAFTVERPVAMLFCVIYLGILDTYAYINNFDAQIANLKSLKTSKGVIGMLENEKKRMLGERLVVVSNIALSEFFKDETCSRELFDQTYPVLLELMHKIEDGFDFDVEIGPQQDLVSQNNVNGDKLVQYLFAINKLLPTPRKGLRHLLNDIAANGYDMGEFDPSPEEGGVEQECTPAAEGAHRALGGQVPASADRHADDEGMASAAAGRQDRAAPSSQSVSDVVGSGPVTSANPASHGHSAGGVGALGSLSAADTTGLGMMPMTRFSADHSEPVLLH